MRWLVLSGVFVSFTRDEKPRRLRRAPHWGLWGRFLDPGGVWLRHKRRGEDREGLDSSRRSALEFGVLGETHSTSVPRLAPLSESSTSTLTHPVPTLALSSLRELPAGCLLYAMGYARRWGGAGAAAARRHALAAATIAPQPRPPAPAVARRPPGSTLDTGQCVWFTQHRTHTPYLCGARSKTQGEGGNFTAIGRAIDECGAATHAAASRDPRRGARLSSCMLASLGRLHASAPRPKRRR